MSKISIYAIPSISINGIKAPMDLRYTSKQLQVIDIVCDHFGVTFEQINTKTRKRQFVLPRQVIMYLLNIHLNVPTTIIGETIFTSKFDHTTVIYSRETVRDQISTGQLSSDINAIMTRIYAL